MMDWIFSDIHGCIHTLESLVSKVKVIDNNPNLVFVGDYVDRGLFSSQVLDFLINLKEKNNCVFLRGNHDDIVSYLLNGNCYTDLSETTNNGDPYNVFIWWMQNGLYHCLKSYNINIDKENDPLNAFRNKVPDAHKDFLNSLNLYWSNDSHFACHAFYPPSLRLPKHFSNFVPKELQHLSLWGRFVSNPKGGIVLQTSCEWDKIGVFGHTPTKVYKSPVPISHDKIRLIDAGGCFGGYITAYCCDKDDTLLQVLDPRDVD
jgi:serine/threonine protein phosphatase 1